MNDIVATVSVDYLQANPDDVLRHVVEKYWWIKIRSGDLCAVVLTHRNFNSHTSVLWTDFVSCVADHYAEATREWLHVQPNDAPFMSAGPIDILSEEHCQPAESEWVVGPLGAIDRRLIRTWFIGEAFTPEDDSPE